MKVILLTLLHLPTGSWVGSVIDAAIGMTLAAMLAVLLSGGLKKQNSKN